MSTGGQAIGGVIGGIVGFYFGNPALGYAIGSGIGGYVDPLRIDGPKLTDAINQTASVGIPIPFGYGVFPVAGNVIWSSPLRENKKSERAGKGGPKVTTYTYTRSYAIGVCIGPIHRFVQIKRNGKVVFDLSTVPTPPVEEDPYPIFGTDEEKWAWVNTPRNQVFQQWIDHSVLYRGDDEQLPDATIESYEGVGNVAPFRGLAYIVVTDDDLTDMRGAIPQYEFVVQTRPEVFLHSKIYPIEVVDGMSSSSVIVMEGPPAPILAEGIDAQAASVISGSLIGSGFLEYEEYPPEGVDAGAVEVTGGSLIASIFSEYEEYVPEGIDAGAVVVQGGSLEVVLIEYEDYPPEGIDSAQVSITSGSLT